MADTRLPPQEFLRECFDYNPETGLFRWKHRPDRHFNRPEIANNWNSKLAGVAAMTNGDKDGYKRCEAIYEGRRYHLRANRVAWKIMTGEEHEMIDHRDLDVTNNRFANLRASDRFGNRHNAPGSRKHLLPKGVSFEKGRFRAQGHIDRRKVHLGSFDTPSEAHAAYCAWARPLHGEFFNAGPEKVTVFD
jgi:hypothetical protein